MISSYILGLKFIKTMFVVALLVAFVFYYFGYHRIDVMSHLRRISLPLIHESDRQGTQPTIHIAVVICGDRLEEGLVMLKSAVIFSHSYLVLHVFTGQELKQTVANEFASWLHNQKGRLKLVIHNIEFPTIPGCKSCTPNAWIKLFRPCAAQRLFIPDLLTDIDSLIYMDTDSVFLRTVEEAWQQFSNFGPRHCFGIVYEIDPRYSWDPVPHCTKTGLNSGVMLMNLTRIRQTKWLVKIKEYFQIYRRKLLVGDQDLINIYCFFHPGLFYMMDCRWNYRGGFCQNDKRCIEALNTGINILHASKKMFHNDTRWPYLGIVYRAFKEYDLSRHTPDDLYHSIANKMKPFFETKCGQRLRVFTRNLGKYIIDYKSIDGSTFC